MKKIQDQLLMVDGKIWVTRCHCVFIFYRFPPPQGQNGNIHPKKIPKFSMKYSANGNIEGAQQSNLEVF